jgi:ornithine cyclodeaminase
VWGRDPEKVEKYMTEMERELRGLGWQVNAASSPGDLLETCDVIVTTTSSRSPLLTHPSVKDGIGEREEGERAASASASFKKLLKTRLIVCVGSDAPGKREVDEGVLACADLFVADSPAQSRERGEFQSSCPPPHLAGKILSLQEALRDPSCHRRRRPKREEGADDPAPNDEDFDEEDHRLVVFDTSGLALQDCVVATMVVEALERTSRPRRR